MGYMFVCDNCGRHGNEPADPEREEGMAGCITSWRQGARLTRRHELCHRCYERGEQGILNGLALAKAEYEHAPI